MDPLHSQPGHIYNGPNFPPTDWLKQPIAPSRNEYDTVLIEREKRIEARVAQRLKELQTLPIGTLPPNLRIKSLIEMKSLNLLQLQKKLKKGVGQELRTVVSYASTCEELAYQRKKSLRESKVNERQELSSKTQGAATEEIEKKAHREFLEAVVRHQREFKEFHLGNQQRTKKITRALISYHSNRERKELQKKEKDQKERLRLLKMQDETAYLNLLEEAKNERLKLLIQQTEEFLNKLGAQIEEERGRLLHADKVEEEKAKAKEKEKKEKEREKEMEKQKEKEKKEENGHSEGAVPKNGEISLESSQDSLEQSQGLSTQDTSTQETSQDQDMSTQENSQESSQDSFQIVVKKNYYAIAHSIEEEITQQPEILVGGVLKEYQMYGLQWLVSLYNNNLNGVLADEMGLGKTIQTIALVSYLIEKKGVMGPFLIVVPLTTMSNWQQEFDKWAPSVKKVVYKGTRIFRKSLFQTDIQHAKFNVVLTTYEYVMRDKSFLTKIKWNYLIIDEGHRMKNRYCKLSIILGTKYYSRHRLLLTGTPLQNSLPELWALLNFLLPTIFNSVENFEQWFNAPFSGTSLTMAMNEEETLLIINRLHKVLRPFLLRRLKSDVEGQLPQKTEHVIKCEASAAQKKIYTMMRKNGLLIVDPANHKGGYKGITNTLMQLRKICNHPYLFATEHIETDDNIYRTSGKFELIDRILPKLKAFNHRVLIFSQMTSMMDIMENYFVYRGYQYLRLDGSTKADNRGELLAKFNAPNSPYFIFILSTRAGGLGLNLQTADTVIIFDSDWNPQIDLQAQDRAHRIGQTNEVRVLRLVTINSIEEEILARATFKLNIDAKIIQAGMFNNQSNAHERKEFLECLLRSDLNKTAEEDVTSDGEINEKLARSAKEKETFDEMDRERDAAEQEAWRLSGGKGPKPPRLQQNHELPDWLKREAKEILDDETSTDYGRGRRERKDVNYSEESEIWLKNLENPQHDDDDDDNDNANDNDDDDDDEADVDNQTSRRSSRSSRSKRRSSSSSSNTVEKTSWLRSKKRRNESPPPSSAKRRKTSSGSLKRKSKTRSRPAPIVSESEESFSEDEPPKKAKAKRKIVIDDSEPDTPSDDSSD
eukprot:TRINITY_DN178_c0_g1_i2.p1 TRINITY_DN178_c0_g1~~TRINITY_DN178_c0_g1_i2.p1  ORF type:complete len:1284 (-),score=358.01 TRINITY_DN178_c0_g1_i2:29-3343(-)